MEKRSLASLVPYSATDKLYIRATLLIRFRPQDDEFQFVLREEDASGNETRINVHLKGRYARACNFLAKGDIVVMNSFVVEPATSNNQDGGYTCTRIVADEHKSNAGEMHTGPCLPESALSKANISVTAVTLTDAVHIKANELGIARTAPQRVQPNSTSSIHNTLAGSSGGGKRTRTVAAGKRPAAALSAALSGDDGENGLRAGAGTGDGAGASSNAAPPQKKAKQGKEPETPKGRGKGKGKAASNGKAKPELKYTVLSDATCETKCINLYGVLTYLNNGPAALSNRLDVCVWKLTGPDANDANDDGLKCSLFHRKEALLPDSARIGDIVRLNRVNVQRYNSQLQVSNAGKSTSMLVFSGRVGDPADKSSARQPHLNINTWSPQDERKIKELRHWAEKQRGSSNLGMDTCVRTIAELKHSELPDILCQVLQVPQGQHNQFCRFTVCDGTTPPATAPLFDMSHIPSDTSFPGVAFENAIRVTAWDDLMLKACNLRVGAFVRLNGCVFKSTGKHGPEVTVKKDIVAVQDMAAPSIAAVRCKLAALIDPALDQTVAAEQAAAAAAVADGAFDDIVDSGSDCHGDDAGPASPPSDGGRSNHNVNGGESSRRGGGGGAGGGARAEARTGVVGAAATAAGARKSLPVVTRLLQPLDDNGSGNSNGNGNGNGNEVDSLDDDDAHNVQQQQPFTSIRMAREAAAVTPFRPQKFRCLVLCAEVNPVNMSELTRPVCKKCNTCFLDMQDSVGGRCPTCPEPANKLEFQYLLMLTVKDGIDNQTDAGSGMSASAGDHHDHGADDSNTLHVIVAGEHAQNLFSPGLAPTDLHSNTHTRHTLATKVAALKSGLIDCTLVSYRHIDKPDTLMWQMWNTGLI